MKGNPVKGDLDGMVTVIHYALSRKEGGCSGRCLDHGGYKKKSFLKFIICVVFKAPFFHLFVISTGSSNGPSQRSVNRRLVE